MCQRPRGGLTNVQVGAEDTLSHPLTLGSHHKLIPNLVHFTLATSATVAWLGVICYTPPSRNGYYLTQTQVMSPTHLSSADIANRSCTLSGEAQIKPQDPFTQYYGQELAVPRK